MLSSQVPTSHKVLRGLVLFLTVSAVYLYAFPQPNVFYAGVVLLHALLGVVAAILLLPLLIGFLKSGTLFTRISWILFTAGTILGLVLLKIGTPRSEWNWLYAHIILSFAAVAILLAEWAGRRGWLGSGAGPAVLRVTICLLVFAALGFAARYQRESRWQARSRITNPGDPPLTMAGEGDGPNGPFFPSSAQVYGNQKIPSKFFMESDSCQALPQGHLQAVVQLGPSLLIIQQPVVPQEHRVHAGHDWHAAFEMVRRMP